MMSLYFYFLRRPRASESANRPGSDPNAIISVTDDSSIAVLHTGAAHGLSDGDRILLSGDVATTYGSGPFFVANSTATSFQLQDAGFATVGYISDATGTWSTAPTSGTILSTTETAGRILVTTPVAHGRLIGDLVTLSGNAGTVYGTSPIQVLGVPSAMTYILDTPYVTDETGTWTRSLP